jgi:hypothetical protein
MEQTNQTPQEIDDVDEDSVDVERPGDMDEADVANGEAPLGDETSVNDTEERYGQDESPV